MKTCSKRNPGHKDAPEHCATLIRDAGHVLIAAGSGMSVDAGIDYTDTAFFARRFPAMAKRGFRMQYDQVGYQGWSESLKWGFLAEHVYAVRWETPPHPVYTLLREIIGDKDHFVMTTNVDGMFAKCGFAADRIFTPQGSYARYQCLKPCTRETWLLRPVIDRIRPMIDTETQEITDPSVIPWCPRCGGPVFMNVRGGNWFIDEPYSEQKDLLVNWVNESALESLLVLEVGSGFNTPGVIRWPMESLLKQFPAARLIRVNRDYPEVPDDLSSRATPLRMKAIDFVTSQARHCS